MVRREEEEEAEGAPAAEGEEGGRPRPPTLRGKTLWEKLIKSILKINCAHCIHGT